MPCASATPCNVLCRFPTSWTWVPSRPPWTTAGAYRLVRCCPAPLPAHVSSFPSRRVLAYIITLLSFVQSLLLPRPALPLAPQPPPPVRAQSSSWTWTTPLPLHLHPPLPPHGRPRTVRLRATSRCHRCRIPVLTLTSTSTSSQRYGIGDLFQPAVSHVTPRRSCITKACQRCTAITWPTFGIPSAAYGELCTRYPLYKMKPIRSCAGAGGHSTTTPYSR